MDRITATAAFEETVPEGDECPMCGEARMDWLTWEPEGDYYGESVMCQTCHTSYVPRSEATNANRS